MKILEIKVKEYQIQHITNHETIEHLRLHSNELMIKYKSLENKKLELDIDISSNRKNMNL